jgi:hypothetical protein
MLTEIYIQAILVNEELADQVWEAWDKGVFTANYQFRGIVSKVTVWRKLLLKRAPATKKLKTRPCAGLLVPRSTLATIGFD